MFGLHSEFLTGLGHAYVNKKKKDIARIARDSKKRDGKKFKKLANTTLVALMKGKAIQAANELARQHHLGISLKGSGPAGPAGRYTFG